MTANLYESDQLQRITGTTLRPGGLLLTDRAVSVCRLKKDTLILDVGCGTGATAKHLKDRYGLNVFGLDRSSLLLQQGRKRNRDMYFVRGDASDLPFPNAMFQAVFCECVLSLTAQPYAVVKEFYRVLVPGGFFILSDVYMKKSDMLPPSAPVSKVCCVNGAMEKERIQTIAARNGFNIFLWEDHTALIKKLAAELVLAGAELMNNFRASSHDKGIGDIISIDDCRATLGYYLMTAKKTA